MGVVGVACQNTVDGAVLRGFKAGLEGEARRIIAAGIQQAAALAQQAVRHRAGDPVTPFGVRNFIQSGAFSQSRGGHDPFRHESKGQHLRHIVCNGGDNRLANSLFEEYVVFRDTEIRCDPAVQPDLEGFSAGETLVLNPDGIQQCGDISHADPTVCLCLGQQLLAADRKGVVGKGRLRGLCKGGGDGGSCGLFEKDVGFRNAKFRRDPAV